MVQTAMLLGSVVALWAGCAPGTPAPSDDSAPGGGTTGQNHPRGVYKVRKPNATPSGVEAKLSKEGPPIKRLREGDRLRIARYEASEFLPVPG